MNRRQFLSRSSTLLAAAGTLNVAFAGANVKRIGLQLFSIPKMLEKSFREGIAFIAGLGYSEVELYGPYPFSAPKAIADWNKVTPQLGFSGSGFFGLTVQEVHSILGEHKISAPSMHTDLLTLQTRMGALAEAAHVLGAKYVTLPSIPGDKRKTLDDYKRMAESFNAIGEEARRNGVRFAYHNHGYGLHEMQGEIPLKLMLRQTDPKQVFFEMDIYWTTAGGGDPVQLLKDYPTRYKMLHLKDMKALHHFKGDGGDPSQWIELFPYMTSVGDGALDIKDIVAQAHEVGVEHYFIEQDMVANPEVALKRSADFLKKL
jgi:sugar phosphate isomerase/epimerase